MNYITVKWSAVLFKSPENRITGQYETGLPQWFMDQGTAEEVVQKVCEYYFTPEVWHQEFGNDQAHAIVRVSVSEPAYAVGEYVVSMERIIEATARKLPITSAEAHEAKNG